MPMPFRLCVGESAMNSVVLLTCKVIRLSIIKHILLYGMYTLTRWLPTILQASCIAWFVQAHAHVLVSKK